MLVNYDMEPQDSLIYAIGYILKYIKDNDNKAKLDDIIEYANKIKIKDSIAFFSLDWLYMINKIHLIDDEVILCI